MTAAQLPECPPFHPRLAALITLWAGLALSLIASIWLHGEEEKHDNQHFQQEANERFMAFTCGINEVADTLLLLNRLLVDAGNASQQQFSAFARPLLELHPYLLALRYHGITQGDQRNVQFMELSPKKRSRPGAAVAAPAAAEEALPDKKESAHPSPSDDFPLDERLWGKRAFSFALPLHRNPAARGADSGYTNAIFRPQDWIRHTLRQGGFLKDMNMGIVVHADNSGSHANPVFTHGAVLPVDELGDSGWFYATRTFNVAGKEWLMVVSAPHSEGGLTHIGSWLLLVGGILITCLLAICFQSLAIRSERLRNSNEALMRDVAIRDSVERELRRSQLQLRELALHQERVREDERKRIAREVHDDLGQNLLALRIDLFLLSSEVAHVPNIRSKFDALLAQIDLTIKSVRGLINNLRPGVLDLGLLAAIEWQVTQMNQRQQVAFELIDEGENFGNDLDEEKATSIFRIVQESMTNIVRHANASSAQIRVAQKDGHLSVTISDNGVGRRPGEKRKPRSFGLIGIKERVNAMGGELAMTSIPGKGTTLSLSIPTEDGKAMSREKMDRTETALPVAYHYEI